MWCRSGLIPLDVNFVMGCGHVVAGHEGDVCVVSCEKSGEGSVAGSRCSKCFECVDS